MPANVQPIYPLTPKCQWGKLTTANTAKDGTGTVVDLFTAGENGARIDQIKVRSLGTNVATVLRLFINNGATNATPANNSLIHEETIAATTLSETAALADKDLLIDKSTGEKTVPIPYLPAGYKIIATIGTTIAAGIQASVHGGDY